MYHNVAVYCLRRGYTRFSEGIEERKLFLEHHQTVDPHARARQVVKGLTPKFTKQILVVRWKNGRRNLSIKFRKNLFLRVAIFENREN